MAMRTYLEKNVDGRPVYWRSRQYGADPGWVPNPKEATGYNNANNAHIARFQLVKWHGDQGEVRIVEK
jgi:hypothetical protein